MSTVNVLHVLWSGRTGGAERFVRDIIRYSDKGRFRHSVCFLSEGGVLAEQMIQLGASVHYLGMKNGLSLGAGLRFIEVIRREDPRIIHNHVRNYFTNFLLFLFPRIKKVYSEHGGSFDPKINSPEMDRYRRFYQIFVRGYDLVFTNAEYLRQIILGYTRHRPEKVKIYHYGIEPQRYGDRSWVAAIRSELKIPVQHKVVGIVGRLVEQKGIDDFIRIAAEIRNHRADCSFVVVGDGPLRPQLEALARELRVDIIFLGDRQDLPRLLPVFDLFVFTSRWEPFGIIILESLASKVAVTGFAVDGMRAIIEKGGGGVLIENRDHLKVAQAAADILSNPARQNQLAAEGYANVQKNFDVRTNIRALEGEYLRII